MELAKISQSEMSVIPDRSEMESIMQIATMAVKSGLIPSAIRNVEAAAIIILKGRELRLPPMVSFAYLYVVNGRPGCAAELLLAGIRQAYPTVSIQYIESSATACKIKVQRPGEDHFDEFSFTIEEAQKAGLATKDVWKNYPTDMLRARAITRMKRAKFPEVMMGLDYSVEELENMPGAPTQLTVEEKEKVLEPKPLPNFAPQATVTPETEDDGEIDEPMVPPSPEEIAAQQEAGVRSDLKTKIMIEVKRLKWSKKTADEAIAQNFKGKTAGSLSIDEMNELLSMLKES